MKTIFLKSKKLLKLAPFVIIPLLYGCVNLDLQSKIPKQSYYTLDKENLAPACNSVDYTIALKVSVNSPYDSKDILVSTKDGEITKLENTKWIDLPRNMLSNLLVKIGLNHCIQVSTKLTNLQKIPILFLNMNNMFIYKSDTELVSRVFLSYELLGSDGKKLKNGVVVTTKSDSNAIIGFQDAIISALKKVITQIQP